MAFSVETRNIYLNLKFRHDNDQPKHKDIWGYILSATFVHIIQAFMKIFRLQLLNVTKRGINLTFFEIRHQKVIKAMIMFQ